MQHTLLFSKEGCGKQQWHIDVSPINDAIDTPPKKISYIMLCSLEPNTHIWIKDYEQIIRLNLPVGLYYLTIHIMYIIYFTLLYYV